MVLNIVQFAGREYSLRSQGSCEGLANGKRKRKRSQDKELKRKSSIVINGKRSRSKEPNIINGRVTTNGKKFIKQLHKINGKCNGVGKSSHINGKKSKVSSVLKFKTQIEDDFLSDFTSICFQDNNNHRIQRKSSSRARLQLLQLKPFRSCKKTKEVRRGVNQKYGPKRNGSNR